MHVIQGRAVDLETINAWYVYLSWFHWNQVLSLEQSKYIRFVWIEFERKGRLKRYLLDESSDISEGMSSQNKRRLYWPDVWTLGKKDLDNVDKIR